MTRASTISLSRGNLGLGRLVVGRMRRVFHVFCVASLLLLSGSPLFSQPRITQPGKTPTERGIDLFVFGGQRVPAGSVLELDVVALGYPAATSTTPVGGAALSATWDPESFPSPPAQAPPTVEMTTEPDGSATLRVPLPPDVIGPLKLLVEVRANGKQRVEEVPVTIESAERLDLVTSENEVVPGGAISAWVLLRKTGSDLPIAGRPVHVELKEGATVRYAADVKTDKTGSAMVRVPIPRSELPDMRWELAASAGPRAADSATLSPREELPQKPSFSMSSELPTVVSGTKGTVRARLLDAGGEPVFGQTVLMWAGPRGTQPPADADEFKKVATRLVTDGAGEVVFSSVAPKIVARKGTELTFVGRTDLEGQTLAATAKIAVGRERGEIELVPEDGSLIPAVKQRVFFRASGEDGKALVGKFELRADGLSTQVTTNDKGEGEIEWTPPRDVGAARGSGPCAGGVAAAVKVRAIGEVSASSARAFSGELVGTDGLPVCVAVDRDATFELRPLKTVVRAGESVEVELVGTLPQSASASPIGYAMTGKSGMATRVGWFAKNARRATISIPEDASGRVDVAISIPRARQEALGANATVLVLPRVVPSLDVAPPSGRLVPKGMAKIEARLRDDAGKPVTGAVALVMIDKFGGGSFHSLRAFDAQRSLCAAIGAGDEGCRETLFGTDEAARRALLAGKMGHLMPLRDPAASLKESLDQTFKTVLKSLEGAVFEASVSPETAPNVRRKKGGKYELNPELMTLVTETMDTPPMLPSGEPVALEDLIAIDSQISYDNVARRLTRLKLFEVLSAARSFRMEGKIDADEPVLADPNVFLRKLVNGGNVDASVLVDPWGGTISFYKSPAPPVPFLTVTKGYELRSPGPDGRLGNGDDVTSPFQRVLKSKTPYADATGEDDLVDARFDMLVADATVSSWQALIHESTGTEWGGAIGDAFGAGGLGLSGIGEGGGGRGQGIGLGSVGTIGHGAGRWTNALPTGVAHFAPPTRTDADGKVSFDVPLGSVETTWQVALVGIPDSGRLAVSTIDLPATLPLSAKVAMGTRLVVGDKVDAQVTLRNRTDVAVVAKIAPGATRALSLRSGAAPREVKVPARGALTVSMPVVARAVGVGDLTIETTAPGVAADRVTHTIEVMPAGERMDTVRMKFLTEATDLGPDLTRAPLLPDGPATIVLERGERETFAAALASVDPDTLDTRSLFADAIQIATLVRDYAVARGDRDLETRANRSLAYAEGKRDAVAMPTTKRVSLLNPEARCPSDEAVNAPIWFTAETLGAEPDPNGGASLPCWTSFVATATTRLVDDTDEASIAQALIALDARAHRRAEAKTLRDHLLALVKPTPAGRITLSTTNRAARSLVYAALIASDPNVSGPTATSAYLPWLVVQRDKRGSFGSVAATRAALVALTALAHARTDTTALDVTIDVDGNIEKIRVPANGRATFAVPRGARAVTVDPGEGKAVFARVERTFLRPYSQPPSNDDAPFSLRVTWPTAKKDEVQSLKVELKPSAPVSEMGDGWASARIRIPLPPGVALADAVPGVRLFRGVLHVTPRSLTSPDTLFVPLRFRLAGDMTVPEATAELIGVEAPRATERARPLVVAP